MTAVTPFRIDMVVAANVAQGKAALSDLKTGMQGVSTEAGKVAQATKQEAAALDAMAAAAARATQKQNELEAAERRAIDSRQRAQIGPVNVLAQPQSTASPVAAFRATETAAASLQQAVAGLGNSLDASIQDMMHATVEARIYRDSLDQIRAAINPLFAASKQYEDQLDRIARAERVGAISAKEAAAARDRAAQIIAPEATAANRGVGAINPFYAANLAAQGNDIVMMMAAGQNPLQLALQQGTQVSQVLNQLGGKQEILRGLAAGFMSMVSPVSLATIAIIALGAAGAQWLMSLRGQSKSAEEALSALADSVQRVGDANKAARMSVADLAAEFGSTASEAKELLAVLAEVERRSAARDAKTALDSIFNDMAGGSMLGLRSQSDRFGSLQRMFGEANWLTSGRISEDASPLTFAVDSAMKQVTAAADTDDRDAQIDAVTELLGAVQAAAAAYDGMSEAEDKWIATIGGALKELQHLKAQDENAAAKAQAAGIVRDLQRRAELEQAILQFGEKSAQVRAIEARQERDALLTRLEGLGVARDSVEAQQAIVALGDVLALREAAALEERRQWLRSKDDQIAALRLEQSLLGATTAEQARANALAEAELEIRDRKLGLLDATLARVKAVARAEAEAELDRQRILRDLQVSATMDQYDLAIGAARDPLTRADLEGQREYERLVLDGMTADLAAAHAAQVRAKSIADAIAAAQGQAVGMVDELDIRQRIAAQVTAGLVPAAEANRLIQNELQLRPLVAAAARAEGEEKRRLLEVITSLRIAQEAIAAEERRQAQNDYRRNQAERIAGLQLELVLVGQTAEVRTRVLSMVRAEQEIRRLGLSGEAAEAARRNAEIEGELVRTLEAQADAWDRVQSAGEAAIDGILDKLRDGDVKGALGDMVGEIEQMFFDLAWRNPLKNAILGTNLGTMNDVGGLRGIWDRLTGRGGIDEAAAVAMGTAPVQSMTVTAAQVTIAGPGVASLMAGIPANLPGAPMAGLPGGDAVQAQIWQFFAARGLQPHQIAGIMGNASAESGFNPLAVGDQGNAFGLFQWNDRRHNLFDFIGGQQNLGDIQKQLEFAWHELMTSENGPFRRLMASTNVREATEAFAGFERPKGYTAGNPSGAMHFDRRLAAAEAAMARFEAATVTAHDQLGQLGAGAAQLGTGLQDFGSGIAGVIQNAGAQRGLGGMMVGGLLTGLGRLVGIPGFDRGGWTGPGATTDVAGLVHAEEFVFDAASTRQIGVANLEAIRRGAMRGYREGGYVTAGRAVAMPSTGGSRGANDSQPQRVVFEINVAGTGTAEIREGVNAAIAQAFETYDRQALPDRVKMIVNDRWGS